MFPRLRVGCSGAANSVITRVGNGVFFSSSSTCQGNVLLGAWSRKDDGGGKHAFSLLAMAGTVGGAALLSFLDHKNEAHIKVGFFPRSSKSLLHLSSSFLVEETYRMPTCSSIADYALLVSWRTFPSDPVNLSKDTRDDSGCKCDSRCLGRDSIVAAAAAVGPSVVNISVTQGFHGMLLGKSIGSGTIIGSDGTILTSAHVVVDFQSTRIVPKGKVGITLQDGRTFEGLVVNADLHSDIAIVKIKSKAPLPAAKLGSSIKLHPGDWVIALGCPLSLQNTVTAGIVSCVDRKSSDLGLGGVRREYLQTDCAINEGNSGGPLVNLDGEVVGVNIMKIATADGLSFAVPIDSVSKIVLQFKKHGKVIRPWLGLKMLDLNEMIIMQLKERDVTFPDVKKGVLVPMVTPGSPADRAGFQPGDVVVEFAGGPVGTVQEIIEAMGDQMGIPIEVLVKRARNNTVKLTVVAEEAAPDR